MIEIPVFNIEGKEIEKISLPEQIFAVKINPGIVHAAVVNHLANKRRGTASTKTRAEVRGGGKKPWRQKGTGRARAGSIRSPLWKGGGIIFGPKPRDYSYRLPRKLKRLALKGAISSKISEGMFVVIDGLKLDRPKTRELQSILARFNPGNALLVTENGEIAAAARNIPDLKVIDPKNLDTYHILNCDKILISKDALSIFSSRFKTSEEEN